MQFPIEAICTKTYFRHMSIHSNSANSCELRQLYKISINHPAYLNVLPEQRFKYLGLSTASMYLNFHFHSIYM
jgi:hypothetical protein